MDYLGLRRDELFCHHKKDPNRAGWGLFLLRLITPMVAEDFGALLSLYCEAKPSLQYHLPVR